ncbi:hypothetical protein [Streptomyces eurythermus]|uniref:hypothetical protein n=2 Tax=Streptomyces TaxID=1883 RepID=UPI00167A6080|nr:MULTISPECIES: hypothetical protein [Streptomyces]MBK3520427.1 hypothetical protein [Streptomyces sp. MBT70]GGR99628.1 hypothetical protein GCM10010236_62890 [Streptomyces eurythermus]
MPADEVTRGTDVDGSRARTGPRHAAPRKPLFTRFHMPAGKAIASVAMPTAVLMGMGFTSTLAIADNNGNSSSSPSAPPSASAKDLTREEYEACVKALDEEKGKEKDPSRSPSPSASEGASDASSKETAGSGKESGSEKTREKGGASSPDSGSDDKATPEPTATSDSASAGPDAGNSGSSGTGSDSSGSDSRTAGSGSGSGADTDTSAKTRDGNLLDTIGDAVGDLLTGGRGNDTGTSTEASDPAPTASQSPKVEGSGTDSGGGAAGDTRKTADDTTGTGAKTGEGTTTGTGTKSGEGDTVKPAGDATPTPSSSPSSTPSDTPSSTPSGTPSPSGSESAAPEDCPVATDEEGAVDNTVAVADDPWYLDASSLYLKGADYQGVVEVRRANGTTKKVLKYVISNGTEIGDLHQTVKDKQANKTYHVQAAKGSTSTITGGDTVMYTESISGNLFGLLPVTFSPDSPPPLNIPLIYFTHVKVVQAAQFGGNLHIPGMRMYTTD